MGYIRHDAIIVTSFRSADAREARAKAEALGLPCSDIIESTVNGYVSFLIGPDGSKEGWEADEDGEEARAAWVEWANATAAAARIFFDWVHVRYGGDDPGAMVCACSNPDGGS